VFVRPELADEAYGLLLNEIESLPSQPDDAILHTMLAGLQGFLRNAVVDSSRRMINVASEEFAKRMVNRDDALRLLAWGGFSQRKDSGKQIRVMIKRNLMTLLPYDSPIGMPRLIPL